MIQPISKEKILLIYINRDSDLLRMLEPLANKSGTNLEANFCIEKVKERIAHNLQRLAYTIAHPENELPKQKKAFFASWFK